MLYNQKKPLKLQLDKVKDDIKKLKPFIDEYIVVTLHRRTDRDLQLLSKIKERTDEKLRIKEKEEQQQRTSDKYKRIIKEME